MSINLKLRAWIERYKKMFYDHFTITHDGKIAWTSVADILAESDNVVLSQFINSRDIHDVDIYTGDLLVIIRMNEVLKDEKGNRVFFEVRQEESKYILYRNDLNQRWGDFSKIKDLDWGCEVVGNIYQNPEMINHELSKD